MHVVHKSRQEFQVHRLGAIATILLPLLAVFLQSYIPVKIHFFLLFDIPLLITIFFAVTRRNQLSGMATGCIIGLLQDGLTHQPVGLNGIAKTVVGYMASSLGVKIDLENPLSRLLMVAGFYVLHQVIYFAVARGLLTLPLGLPNPFVLAGSALVNGVLAVILYAMLDRFRKST